MRIPSLVLMALLSAGALPVFGQNPDYDLVVGDGLGNPGQVLAVDVVLDHGGDPVEAWSFSLCHDPALLTPDSASIGVDAAAVNGGSGPDFFVTSATADGIFNLAIISLLAQDVFDPGTYSLLEASYLLGGAPGITTVSLCDTVGTPPVQTILVVDAEGVIPVLTDGTIEISGTPIPPEFAYVAPTTTAVFQVDTGQGTAEISPTVEQTNGFPAETTAFSMGLAHDPDFLEATFATPAGPLAALNGGAGPDLFVVDILVGGVTIEVVYSMAGTETILYGSPLEPVDIQYITNPVNLQGVMSPVTTDLSWADDLGTPPVPNLVTFGTPPDFVSPALEDGTLTLLPSGSPQGDYFLEIPDAVFPPGGVGEIECLLSISADPIQGWQWGVCHDDAAVTLDDVQQGSTVMTVNNGGPPDFYALSIFPGDGWAVGAVVDFTGSVDLPAGIGYQMNTATYDVIGPDGTFTAIDFCNTLGNPVIQILLVDDNGNQQIPITEGATIEIAMPVPVVAEFLRGDGDGDGVTNGLVDGIFLLSFQFVIGSPAPPCFDAADVDDDGAFNGLVDSLFLLNWQFIQGSAPPPSPGPDACGADPTTADALDCLMHPCI